MPSELVRYVTAQSATFRLAIKAINFVSIFLFFFLHKLAIDNELTQLFREQVANRKRNFALQSVAL